MKGMKMFFLYSFVILLAVAAVGVLMTLIESFDANSKRVDGTNYQEIAAELQNQTSKDEPVIIVVPLNGTPDSIYHPSFKNAYASLQLLQMLQERQKVLLLSEGYAAETCVSGAEITLGLLGLQEGYNSSNDVTILLENNASTTYENIQFSKSIIEEVFPKIKVSVFIAGMSDEIIRGLDIGHGARAYMLGKQNLQRDTIQLNGYIATNKLDPTVQNYSSNYNLLTMVAGANRLLTLPYFDKKTNGKLPETCTM